jgi:hypothetical protein
MSNSGHIVHTENESTVQQKYRKRKNMRNIWFQKMLLLSSFILLDYLITLLLISYPGQEANILARSFMETFGVTTGLTLFSLLINIPVFLILGMLAFHPRILSFAASPAATPGLDIAFAWFVAGTHFSGALSWLVDGPSLLYQLTGAALYLDLLFIIIIWRRQHAPKPNAPN